jgi:hypothetical protein
MNEDNAYQDIPESQHPDSLKKLLGGFAVSIAAWGLYHKGATAVLQKAESGLLNILRNTTNLKSERLQALRKASIDAPDSSLWQLMKTAGDKVSPTLGAVVRNWDDAAEPAEQFFRRHEGRRFANLRRLRDIRRLTGNQRTDLFRSSMAMYAKQIAVEAPLFYVGEQAVGIFNRDPRERQKESQPAWYNIPGHAVNFAKWLPTYVGFDLLGRVGIGAAGALKDQAALGLRKGLQSTAARSVVQDALVSAGDTIATIADRMHRMGDAYKYAWRQTGGESGRGVFLVRDQSRMSQYRLNRDPVGTLVERYRLFNQRYRATRREIKKELPVSTAHRHLIKKSGDSDSQLTRLYASYDPRSFRLGKKTEDALIEGTALRATRSNFLTRYLGLVPARLHHIKKVDKDLYERIYEDLRLTARETRSKFHDKQTKESIRRVVMGRDKTEHLRFIYDEHVFFDPRRGKLVDMRNVFDIPGKIYDFAEKALSFGGRFSTLRLFQLHHFRQKTERAILLTGKKIIPSSAVENAEFLGKGPVYQFKPGKPFGSEYHPEEMPGVGLAIYNPKSKGYQVHVLSRNTREYVPLTHDKIRPIHLAGHSKLYDIIAKREGLLINDAEPSDIPDSPQTKYEKIRRWLYDKYDLFAGDGNHPSLWQIIRARAGKFGPKRLFHRNRTEQFLREAKVGDYKEQAEYLAYAEAALNTLLQKNKITLRKEIFEEIWKPLNTKYDPDAQLIKTIQSKSEEILSSPEEAYKAVRMLLESGNKSVLEKVPQYRTIQREINAIIGAEGAQQGPPEHLLRQVIGGTPLADNFRQFLVNYRLISAASFDKKQLTEEAGTLSHRVLNTVDNLIGNTAVQRDRTYLRTLLTYSQYRNRSGGLSPAQIIEKENDLERFNDLINIMRQADEEGLLQEFSKEISWFSKYTPPDNYQQEVYRRVNETYGNDPYMLLDSRPGELFGLVGDYVYDTFGSALDFMGLGFSRARYPQLLPYKQNGEWHGGLAGLMAKRALLVSGVGLGYNALDTFTDLNPAFDGTVLDEGITVALADQAVNARLLAARIFDITGVTDTARYLEGLMPKSTSVLPGAVTGFLAGGLPGALAGAVANRYLQVQLSDGPFSALALLPPFAPFVADLTQSYEDLQKIYSGEELVPYRSGRGWSTGATPLEGGRIKAWVPSWYTRLKSQYTASPSLYGSAISEFIYKDLPFLDFSLGDIIDPQGLERYHAKDRPYVIPSTPFSEVPIIGPLLGATAGRLYNFLHPFASNTPRMLAADGSSAGDLLTSAGYAGAPVLGMEGSSFYSDTGRYKEEVASPWDTRQMLAETVYRGFIEPAGLYGFATSSILWGGNEPFAGEQPVFAAADEMDSFRRSYWDMNLGDMMLINEGFRRLFPRPRTDEEKVGLLPNEMPSWVPSEYKTGDPYCLTPDTLVEVNGGLVRADEVMVGDLIRTVKGRPFPVAKVVPRPVSEDIYVVKLKQLPFEIKVTSEHPFYVKKENDSPVGATVRGRWIEIKDLSEEDTLLYPKLSIKPRPVWRYMRNWVKVDMPISPKVARMLGCMITSIGTVNDQYFILRGPHENELRWLIHHFFGYLPRSTGRYRTEFLRKLVDDLINGDSLPLGMYGVSLETMLQFLKPLCTVEENENDDNALAFKFRGPNTAYQAWSIMASLGYNGYVDESHTLRFYVYHARMLYKLLGYDGDPVQLFPASDIPERNRLISESSNYQLVDIEYIRTEPYEGLVYGFEVDVDDSFCVPGVATHNTKVPFGEALLPGAGYEATHNLHLQFMVGPSQLGYSAYEQALRMIGIQADMSARTEEILEEGDATHHAVQTMLQRLNENVKAEALIYDPYNNIKGYVDVMLPSREARGGYMPVEIKSIGSEGFSKLNYPKHQHLTQLNTYLNILKEQKGILLYVNRDDPSQIKTFDVRYDERLYSDTISRLNQAKELAASYIAQGYGKVEQAYSWVDRAKVLLNADPYGKSMRETLDILDQRITAGVAEDWEIKETEKLKRMHKAMMWKWEMYPHRFEFGKILTPDVAYENYSLNENIKAAAEYSLPERALGGVWEKLTHLRSPLHSKLFGLYSPEERYENSVLYGRDFQSWSKPIDHWLKPYAHGLRAVDDPVQGVISYGIGGLIFGGPVLASLTVPFGAAYGAIHGMYRGLTGTKYIPEEFEEKAQLNSYFDRLRYYRANMMYQTTKDARFLKEMKGTTTYWQLTGLPDEGMRQESRKRHNPAAQGLGTDLGFGSPWRGIVHLSDKVMTFLSDGDRVLGQAALPHPDGSFMKKVRKILSGKAEGVGKLNPHDRNVLSQLMTHSRAFDPYDPIILINSDIVKAALEKKVPVAMRQLRDTIRHERMHALIYRSKLSYEDMEDFVKQFTKLPEGRQFMKILKNKGYNADNPLEAFHETLASAAEYSVLRAERPKIENIKRFVRRTLPPEVKEKDIDTFAEKLYAGYVKESLFTRLRRSHLHESQASTQMRRIHNPAAQGLGSDKGFGSPWQGSDPDMALLFGDPNLGEQVPARYNNAIDYAIGSLPYWDRPFFFPFLNAEPDRRKDILKMVDPQMRAMLQLGWGYDITKPDMNAFNPPSVLDPSMHPDVNLDDVMMVTAEQQGFDAHDFGLGWMAQRRRIANSPHNISAININGETPPILAGDQDPVVLRQFVEKALKSFGINNFSIQFRQNPDDSGNHIQLNLSISRNRSRASQINLLKLFED